MGAYREAIFQLKAQGLSQRKIAAELGISKTLVVKELALRADQVAREGAGGSDGVTTPPLPAGADPMLAESRRRLEQERLELLSIDVQAKRLEAQQRLELLQNRGRGGDGAATLIVIEQIRELRSTVAALAQQAGRPAPAAPPQPSLTDKLSEWKSIGETVASFQPPKGPQTAFDLELHATNIRLQQEERRIARQQDMEWQERQDLVASARGRDSAIAAAIEHWSPVLAAAAEQWFKNGASASATPGWQPRIAADESVNHSQSTPGGLRLGEIEGTCPSCQQRLALVPGEADSCANCGAAIAVVDGQVVARGNGAREVPRFAS